MNTASPDLTLRQGAVSNSIVNLGGDTIQQECRAEYPNGINYGEIAITKAGKLDCMLVFHGALPQRDNIGNSIKVGCKYDKVTFGLYDLTKIFIYRIFQFILIS